jgi:hypothetical protein
MARIPDDLAQRVRETAKNRCGYCLSPQKYVMGRLEIEHIQPTSKGGSDDEVNLWLSCSLCNGHKADKVGDVDPSTGEFNPLFNPRTQKWSEHFKWSDDGIRVIGITPVGRATVKALHLDNDPDALIVREEWVKAGWHPPKE